MKTSCDLFHHVQCVLGAVSILLKSVREETVVLHGNPAIRRVLLRAVVQILQIVIHDINEVLKREEKSR